MVQLIIQQAQVTHNFEPSELENFETANSFNFGSESSLIVQSSEHEEPDILPDNQSEFSEFNPPSVNNFDLPEESDDENFEPFEPFGFEQLFNPDMGGNNNQALADLNVLLRQLTVAPLPTFAGLPTEDPVQWLDDFNRVARSSNVDEAARLAKVGAYLHGDAAAWYDVDHANCQNWEQDNNDSFKTRFLNQFRTAAKINKWRDELLRRMQKPGESVTSYAKDVKSLIKRIAPAANAMTNSEKVYHFTKGLNPELNAQMTPALTFQPNTTLSQAIEYAQRLESDKARLQQFQPVSPSLIAAT